MTEDKMFEGFSAPAILMLTALCVTATIAVRSMRKLWRNQTTAYDRPWPGWVWSEASWKGVVRAWPVTVTLTTAYSWGILLGVLLARITDNQRFLAIYAAAFVALPLVANILLGLPIFLFARPKRLIPRHLRSDSGAISVWWRNGRQRFTNR